MSVTVPLQKILCPACKKRGINSPLCEIDGEHLIINRHRAHEVFIEIHESLLTMRCFTQGCTYMFVTNLSNTIIPS